MLYGLFQIQVTRNVICHIMTDFNILCLFLKCPSPYHVQKTGFVFVGILQLLLQLLFVFDPFF